MDAKTACTSTMNAAKAVLAGVCALALAFALAPIAPAPAEAATLAPAQVDVSSQAAQAAAKKPAKRVSIAKAKVKLAKKAYTYTGKAVKPKMTVKLGKKTLKLNRDYTIANKSNTKAASKAKVVIKGIGRYKGTKVVAFKIAKAKASKLKVSFGAKTFAYTGKALKPKPTVKLGGVTLAARDYKVSYRNNVKAGTATVTIKGKGSVTGTKKATFKISKSKSAAAIDGAGNVVDKNDPIANPSNPAKPVVPGKPGAHVHVYDQILIEDVPAVYMSRMRCSCGKVFEGTSVLEVEDAWDAHSKEAADPWTGDGKNHSYTSDPYIITPAVTHWGTDPTGAHNDFDHRCACGELWWP